MSNNNRKQQLEKIEQAENRLQARKQRITNSIKTEQRKLDTRMKILLGSLFLKAAQDDGNVQDRVKKAVLTLSIRDQKVFETLFESWSNQ